MSAEKWAVFEDRWLGQGFTQIPNAVQRNYSLSVQARWLYGTLPSFAWEDDEAFPGMATLAVLAGSREDTVLKWRLELEGEGLIEVKRRGQGKTNLYTFKHLTRGLDYRVTGGSRTPEKPGTNNTQIKNITPSGGQAPRFVALLAEKLTGARPPLTANRKGRYGKEYKQAFADGYTEEELMEATDRIVDRWPDFQLSVEQALRDLQSRRQGKGGVGEPAHPHSAEAEAARDAPRRADWYAAIYNVNYSKAVAFIERYKSHKRIVEELEKER